MIDRPVRVWVHPSFKKKLKQLAADADISICELSERIGGIEKEFNFKEKRREKHGFDFRF